MVRLQEHAVRWRHSPIAARQWKPCVSQHLSSFPCVQTWVCGVVKTWSDCVLYDDLTINERQKGDKEYSSMLDNVRCACPTEDCLSTLKQMVIQVPVSEKNFNSLANHLYVCFPLELHVTTSTRKLTLLDTTVHQLKCKDKIKIK